MKMKTIIKSLLSIFALVFIFIPNVNADGHSYTIDASNVSQYADMLTEGEKKMFEAYPDTYKINVGPATACSVPADVMARSSSNGTMINNNEGIEVANSGQLPFPNPSDAQHYMWNARMMAGTQSNINSALESLRFKGNSGTITIKTYETASGVKYSKSTEHFYNVVSDATNDNYEGANGARAKALASSYNGLDGYLCNINSQAENDFLEDLFVNNDSTPGDHTHQSMWLGGYAASGETNTWRDGPDAGTSIPTSGSEYFNNWNSGEPNNTAEDYVIMYYRVGKRGMWHDTTNTALDAADHYCIEYDHTDTLSTSSYATASITLTSTTSLNSTTKAIIRSQTITASYLIRQSISNIQDRMRFTRNLDKNISNQNIKLALNIESEKKKQILNNLNSYFFNKDKNLFDNFAIWTKVSLGNGKIKLSNDILNEDIYNSNSLTIGVDSKLKKNNSLGLALTLIARDPEIGSDKAYIDANSFNIASYASMMLDEKEWIDFLIGLGKIEFDIDRKVSSSFNNGSRDGKQIFSSFKYTKEPKKNLKKNISIYSKFDLGFTQLDSYTETGSSELIYYNKQYIKQATLGIGSNVSKVVDFKDGFFIPFVNFETGANIANISDAESSYTTSSSVSSYKIKNDNTSFCKLNIGFEADLYDNWEIKFSYDYYEEMTSENNRENQIQFTVAKKLMN